MMTRTAATDYFNDGIHMNSVDTGWVTDEDPDRDRDAQDRGAAFPSAARQRRRRRPHRRADHHRLQHRHARVGTVPEGLQADRLVRRSVSYQQREDHLRVDAVTEVVGMVDAVAGQIVNALAGEQIGPHARRRPPVPRLRRTGSPGRHDSWRIDPSPDRASVDSAASATRARIRHLGTRNATPSRWRRCSPQVRRLGVARIVHPEARWPDPAARQPPVPRRQRRRLTSSRRWRNCGRVSCDAVRHVPGRGHELTIWRLVRRRAGERRRVVAFRNIVAGDADGERLRRGEALARSPELMAGEGGT